MISPEPHKKHGDLVRPTQGKFGRREIAIMGTDCAQVGSLASEIISRFPDRMIAFADADHSESKSTDHLHWQDKISSIEISGITPQNEFQRRQSLSEADLVLVNGNHFQAQEQIIVANPDKENSLRKRAEQLTSVKAVILPTGVTEIPNYIRELLPDGSVVEIFHEESLSAFHDFIQEEYLAPAPLKALIMAGGRSIRMGKDKSRIAHHGVEQFLHLTNLLHKMGIDSYISCREEQAEFYRDHGCAVITDRVMNIGPLGGIISAWMSFPDNAWLVLACDIPLLDESIIHELIRSRKPSRIATSFKSPFDKFPEPLIAIWEPKAYPIAMQFIAQGHSCPRKVLINSNTEVIQSATPDKLENVNTQEELNDLADKL